MNANTANEFVAKLKADGSKNDWTDLDAVFNDYKDILGNLSAKERGPFSLNVLCILCRNLEKVPSWRTSVNNKELLMLSIDCLRQTRILQAAEQVKVLACVYHIHRHVARQSTDIPPELVLKLSYMPFETDNVLAEYSKTYWNILADRINYIEKLKSRKMNIIKLFQKVIDDAIKVIKIYNTVQFCSTIIRFLVKKLSYLYSDLDARELMKTLEKIFEEISAKNDLIAFKKLPDQDVFDIYLKLSDCLYVVAENSSKIRFESSVLNTAVQTCISIIGHRPDLLHCIQTVYLNGFCSILTGKQNLCYVENILNNMVTTFETSEKLGYVKAMNATYPYVNNFLKLYIESNIATGKTWQKCLPEGIQVAILKLMEFLLKKLKNCEQMFKCESCSIKSRLHDAIRLSLFMKYFITIPLQEELNISKTLPIYFAIILRQYEILKDLREMECINYEKCLRKLQSDVHNTAILLNKSQYCEYSIKLFDIYLGNEILNFKNENDMKNISRALYNKSICELDNKQFENALSDAYLSLIFAYPDGLSTEKHMSLVMDIKAKVLKLKTDDSDDDDMCDDIQLRTVLDACATAADDKKYGNLKRFLCNLKFSELLTHEFEMYVKLWPSIAPIAGVWKTLYDLTQYDVPWLTAKDNQIQDSLFKIILQTPTAVRTIQHDGFKEIVKELLESFERSPPITVEAEIFHATLLFLQAEYDLTDASQKHGWKVTEPSMDPDNFQAVRTMAQEFEATKNAILAVETWARLVRDIDLLPATPSLKHALQTVQVFVPELLHLCRTSHGLQLAHVCCRVAQRTGDKASYLVNASTILYHASEQTDEIKYIITTATEYCAELIKNEQTLETALVFLCDCSIFYCNVGLAVMAARLVQVTLAVIVKAYDNIPDVNLDLAIGHCLEAQARLGCDEQSTLTAAIGCHRHYLTVGNGATKWTSRRLRALSLKHRICVCGERATLLSRRLAIWRRARAAVGAVLPAAAALCQVRLYAAITNASLTQDARTKLDNRLKHILGIQSALDQPAAPASETKSHPLFTPKQELETMLEHMTFKKAHTSPTCLEVPGFRMPEFLKHSSNCQCYACENPHILILACQTAGLEASMYFRAKEYVIAKNYFDGAIKCVHSAEKRLKVAKKYEDFDKFIVGIADKMFKDEFINVELDILMETAFFEMSQDNFASVDEFIVKIHEIFQENDVKDPYLHNELLNLMTTSTYLKKGTNKKTDDVNLEEEFENLKLSPTKTVPIAKTPECKAEKPPRIAKIKLKDEEVPNTKRRVIKLNLDDVAEEKEPATTKRVSKRTEFKIPVPVTLKPVLESLTPTPRRKPPPIIVTQASVEQPSTSVQEFTTPKPKNVDDNEFFTPSETPSEQFFTPMSKIKTYSKKTLRKDIVKNLETEFATPKSVVKTQIAVDIPDKTKEIDKENVSTQKSKAKTVETGSVKSLKDKRTLKRATSPGKLPKNDKKTGPMRSSRLRQPIRLSVDRNDE